MLSMFKEKDLEGRPQNQWSMTRVVAFLAAMTLNWSLLTMARKDHVHDIGWPFCAMYIVTLLAVPIQMIFKYLQTWLATGPGQALLRSVIEKVQAAGITLGGSSTPSATVKTEMTVGDKDK